MVPSLKEIESVFFDFMQVGYASSGSAKVGRTITADMPGFKGITYRDGDYYVLDRYCVRPDSDFSVGNTVIWFQKMPIWTMSYEGTYSKRVIPFLKTALLYQYSIRVFLGGRGPRKLEKDGLCYFNFLQTNDFNFFKGREKIISEKGEHLGYHDYRGMSLV